MSTTRVSVIFPSRLDINPAPAGDYSGNPFLERAVSSVQVQSQDDVEIEYVIALDAEHPPLPERRFWSRCKIVEAGKSQVEAMNAGVAASTGNVIAFLEDDDYWEREKLECQLPLLAKHGFVSCNQRETDVQGAFIKVNNFATPSGWLMPRETWEKVGPFDTAFRYHLDTDWLGRLNQSGISRVHLVEEGCAKDSWMAEVGKRSALAATNEIHRPLVNRFVHPGSGMAAIAADGERLRLAFMDSAKDPGATEMGTWQEGFIAFAATQDSPFGQSAREHAILTQRYGVSPW